MQLNPALPNFAREQKCDVLLVLLEPNGKMTWTLVLNKDEQLIGTTVKGNGRLRRPGVENSHAKVWLDRKTICLQPNGSPVWLNLVPLAPDRCVTLVKGDRLHLGSPNLQTELFVTCTAELASAKQATAKVAPATLLDDDLGVSELTTAEQDVLVWLARGETDLNVIAESLYRSVNTVNTQLKKVYSKLKVHSKADLSAQLLRYRDTLERQKTALGRFAGTCDCRQ
jgi:DNA-binding CsgD family transcriptional regulator